MDRNTQRKADETWDNFVAQLRMLVTSAHETAVDAAFATVTQREKARGGDKAALAFWEGHLKNRPALAAFIAPQMDRLKAVEPPDVVANGGFERLAGDPPRPEGWLTYQDYGMMKATKNNYSWAPGTGRDGGRAFGLGDGAYAELRSVVKLEAGRRYALSLWYRTENREGQPASFTAFHVSGEIEDPATIETKRIDARFLWFDLEPTNGEWRRFTCAFTPSQGGSFILQPVGGRQKPGQWVWFDDVEIRKIW
jgi:hypothetical protein